MNSARPGLCTRMRLTVNGKTIWENVQDAECYNRQVIYSFANPFKPLSGIAVLRGNLAPQGAVIKPSAATPELLVHRGRAVVFENIEQLHETIDDENLEIDETCVMVLKGAGPKGYPGFAEVGNMPLPPKLLRKGDHRHGTCLGRPDERHRFWYGRSPCGSGSGGGRTARPGQDRRYD